MRASNLGPGRVVAPKPLTQIIKSSLGLSDWPALSIQEIVDHGGVARDRTENDYRVFIMLGGEVETWWRADGFARSRRALPGAISTGVPGPILNSSWTGHRHTAYATIPERFVRSVMPDEQLNRLANMGPRYCLNETYERADEGFALVLGLRNLLYSPEPGTGLVAEELGIRLVNWMQGMAGSRPPVVPADGLNRVQLQRVVDRIDADLCKPFTLRDLADVAGVTPFHFCRMFRRATGLSPWQFVIRWRVDRATTMLMTHGSASLSAVATACGFVDQSHMTRLFKRHRGMTPREFAGVYGKRQRRAS